MKAFGLWKMSSLSEVDESLLLNLLSQTSYSKGLACLSDCGLVRNGNIEKESMSFCYVQMKIM